MPAPSRASRAYVNLARVVRTFLLSSTRRDWHGAEHLAQPGGFIAVGNHATNIDPLTFAHYLWDNGVAPRIMAKDSLWKIPVLRSMLTATGQIPVSRGAASAGESLKAAEQALASGECVVVFPEGTLTREPDLWPMQGKTGVARLALATRAPVVPIAQWGAHRLLGRYRKLLKPIPRKTITVVAGPPVDLSDLYDKPVDGTVLRVATDRIMDAVTHQLEQIRGEQAPAERFVWRKGMPEPGR
ncbi:1-acyl-sn-glycerol-3-phosphate acyltransferase [Actinotalea sp. M2MS4P-6]|uniref:lysophospholipid acyltransferase family protein n=1 Tax=Actinotalea sp. M2MS4P-6 TaxID=2983762 RepID=UPI0021E4BCD5|nr:lysophospholipid acyltransferase family protein [Actinotalea sp. M2MS4P-6]MCV2393998.1 1-acyl-sn-glycerol-3-phosphate acyltransferase [Actinotalea sp. M2MS4P-6]